MRLPVGSWLGRFAADLLEYVRHVSGNAPDFSYSPRRPYG